jgi:SAM-dependent methyltransferase
MGDRLSSDGFYEDAQSLFVEAYDAFYPDAPAITDFYERLARESGGPVLELACGTGRFALALARRGLDVTGADISEGMLAVARRKAVSLPAVAAQRLTFACQDMSALALDRRFGFVFIPARSFQHLLTADLQKQTLAAVRRHLVAGGRLSLNLFDPRLDLLIDENAPVPKLSGIHPVTGRRYLGEMVQTRFDHLAQVRHDLWRYAELAENSAVLAEDWREMALRWTYRWELRHLLELCGFTMEAEYSDFAGSPPAYGKELIVITRAAA